MPGAPPCPKRGVAPDSGPDSEDASSEGGELEVAAPGGWDYAEALLTQAAGLLADGAADEVLGAQMKRSCENEPSVGIGPEGEQWTCVLRDAPKLDGREFSLEYGAAGIVSLAAFDLDPTAAAAIIEQSRERFQAWCVDRVFSDIEGSDESKFLRCALPGGPILVLGRFLRDLDADLWQVSLAVMAAG